MIEAYSLVNETDTGQELPGTSAVSASASLPVRRQVVLAMVLSVPLSSSSVNAEQLWARLFPQSSTLQADPPDVRWAVARLATEVLPSTAEQLAAVQGFFCLSKTQLAAVCGVQRQTIYDWYAEKFEAEAENARRMTQLYELVTRLKASGLAALSGRVVARSLTTGETLLDVLSEKDIDEARLTALVTQLGEASAQQKARSAAAARERLGWPRQSQEAADQVLESNLEDLVDG